MASTTLFQVFLFVILMVSCSCIARTNEIQGLTQGDVGYLASQLILKVFSDLEADIQELKAKVADTQKLKAEITDLKSKYEGL